MALSDTIKSFLVSLSYSVDRPSEKRFKDGLETAGKGVTEFARVASKSMLGFEVASIASFAAITAGLEKTASKYESLYYLGQRSGASIKGINEFAYAVSQLGGTAEGARSSIEGLGAFLRSSPGAESVLRGLGVATRGAGGQMRDTADIATDLGDRLKAMPMYQAQRYASMFGIDVPTLFAMRSGLRGYEEELDRYYKMFGFNAERAGQIAVEFDQRQRTMQAVATALFERGFVMIGNLADKVAPKVSAALSAVEADFAAAWPTIKGNLAPLGTWLEGEFGKSWTDVIKGYHESIHELETDFADVAPNVMAVLKPLTDYFKGDWKKDLSGFLKDLQSLEKFINDAAAGHWAAAGKDLLDIYHNDTDGRKDISATVTDKLTGGASTSALNSMRSQNTGLPTAQREANTQSALSGLQQLGMSRGAAIGFAANLMKESGLNPAATNGSHWGIAQWDARRADAIKAATGIDVRTDTNFADQMRAVAWELHGPEARTLRALAGVRDPRDASTIVNHAYERSVAPGGDWTFEDHARRSIAGDMASRYGTPSSPPAGQTVTVGAPQTTITVHGSGDPHATARAVADKQTQVQASLVRNLVSVAH